MSKGIALETLAGVTLAVIGISLLIAIVSGVFEGGFDVMFCSIYGATAQAIPGDMSVGSTCGQDEGPDYVFVEAADRNEAALEIISSISSCKREKQGSLQDQLCQGMNMESWGSDPIEFQYLVDKMRENNVCPDIISVKNESLNSNCGNTDQLEFESVNPGDTIFIRYKYNETESREYVEVEN